MFQVPDYPAYYVDRRGNVWNTKGPVPRKSNLIKDEYGYLYVALRNGKKTVKARVHKLVLQAFEPEPEPDCTVVHINGDRTDNRLENLQWAPPRGKPGARISKQPINKRGIKLNLDKIRLIREMASKGIPQRQIADRVKTSQSNVSRVVTGETWKHLEK